MKLVNRFALLGLVLGLGVTGAAYAQPFQNTPPSADNGNSAPDQHAMPDPQKQTARLSRKLQLTPDQAAKIEPIIAMRQQQMQQMRADTSASPRDLHQKMRALKQSTDSQIQAILTDSQRQQYQQMQQQAMQKHMEHKQGAPAAGDGSDDNGG
jgi:protein CpxP